jgi:hypothetical protein
MDNVVEREAAGRADTQREAMRSRGNLFNFRSLKWGNPANKLKLLPEAMRPRLMATPGLIEAMLIAVIAASGIVIVVQLVA